MVAEENLNLEEREGDLEENGETAEQRRDRFDRDLLPHLKFRTRYLWIFWHPYVLAEKRKRKQFEDQKKGMLRFAWAGTRNILG